MAKSTDNPMILFDARLITETPSGIGVYAQEMLSRIPRLAPDLRFRALFRSAERRDAVLAGAQLDGLGNFSAEIIPYGPFSPKSQLKLPALIRRSGASVFHTPNFIMPYFAFPRNGRCACVANIHDIIPLVVENYAPNSRTSKFKGVYRECIRQSVLRSRAVITGSEAAKNDIVRELRLSPETASRCRVIFDGATPSGSADAHTPVKDAADLTTPRLLIYVGRMDPYKNVPLLVGALEKIRAKCPFPVTLKVIGPKDPRYPEAERRAVELGLGNAVDFTGFVSAEELATCYRTADLLTHPSRYEGFGLQLIEAMSAGTPVLCTDGGSQPEVAGDAAVVVPAGDEDAFAAAATDILLSPERQAALRHAGALRAKDFTWDATAHKTLALYRELIDGGNAK